MAGAQAQFVPPAEGPVPFRRDRLPLDVEAIAGLSQSVTRLAGALPGDTAESRRAAAQALALALALDPSNSAARRELDRFQNEHRGPKAGVRPGKTRLEIWEAVAWLQTPDAGADGRALASCLKDVMAVADPENPRSAAHRKDGEPGAWNGWVPALAAYRKPEPPPEDPEPDSEPAAPVARVPLAEAEVLTPIWRRIPGGEGTPATWSIEPQPLHLKARPLADRKADFTLIIGANQPEGAAPEIGKAVADLLRARHPSLPKGMRVQITSAPLEQSIRAKKDYDVSAAALVLAEAALSGKAPAGTIAATVDSSGGLGIPPGFWEQLRSIAESPPGRIVVPAAGTDSLRSFLVLEKPEFFMSHEVLIASNADQLITLSAAEPDPAVAAVLAKFHEVQSKLGSQDLRLYIGNRFVKQRLAEIVQEAPWHYSARMLLTQATGNRPVVLPRAVLAAELLRELRPMDEIARQEIVLLNVGFATRAGTVHGRCREGISGLERYVAREDRPLLDETDRVLAALRAVERAPRNRSSDTITALMSVQDAATAFKKIHKEFQAKLLRETGGAPAAE